MDYQNLMNLAESVRENAYAPYSNFKVGAAVLAENNLIFTGCNVENSCGTSCCAERVAIYNAIAHGCRDLVAVAVAGEGEVFPCGICRQVIAEFSQDIVIIVKTKDGIKEYAIDELLPNAFRLRRE